MFPPLLRALAKNVDIESPFGMAAYLGIIPTELHKKTAPNPRCVSHGLLAPRTGCTIHTAPKGFGRTRVDEAASVEFLRRCNRSKEHGTEINNLDGLIPDR
jgi:hypothetical protein